MMVNYGHGDARDEPDPLHEEAADEIERLRRDSAALKQWWDLNPSLFQHRIAAAEAREAKLRELVERARQIIPDCYVTWHDAAIKAVAQENSRG
jgi:hypothetical protein